LGGGSGRALAYAPERAYAVLDHAGSGARWRTELSLPEPSERLNEAIGSMVRTVRAVSAQEPAPAFGGLLRVLADDDPDEKPLDGVVRHVLLSMLEERRTRQPDVR
jgi:hypothetical protein